MNEFFEGMSTFEQAYWIIAILGSIIFLIIFALTFIGASDVDMEADISDVDADDGGVGFQFFTFKNVIAFFTIFGWTGILCIDNELSTIVTIFISSFAGLLMMILTSLLFFWIHKMAESGTLKIKNAIGAIGEVYLPIGANRSSIGKIQIKVQGSLRELEAVTDSEEILSTSTIVKVVEIIGSELLLVEKLSN
ncbi:hypothetical protein IWQ47_005036 [Aquimarina sp. EL_43]|uniref:hypothetical protein n=1 Tax=unclassified Aquimarina TaxID=2627091 RepID=UPI0018C9F783|nr:MULTISPECIES: hypothetical protein [unclassified Aquimarina]MBG6133611.1 hypothetical protein [Aquimarina sp. EL_35]MBG6153829.1 hypothetical protein [Aquimarina sp. EL_32]MBG6171937.1 hypothetical protein [Aquimarina sp. EL_43]